LLIFKVPTKLFSDLYPEKFLISQQNCSFGAFFDVKRFQAEFLKNVNRTRASITLELGRERIVTLSITAGVKFKAENVACNISAYVPEPPPLGLTGTCHFCRQTPEKRDEKSRSSARLSQYRTAARFSRA